MGHDRGREEGVIRLVAAVVVDCLGPAKPCNMTVDWNGDLELIVVFMVPRRTSEEPKVRCTVARTTHVVVEVVVIMVEVALATKEVSSPCHN